MTEGEKKRDVEREEKMSEPSRRSGPPGSSESAWMATAILCLLNMPACALPLTYPDRLCIYFDDKLIARHFKFLHTLSLAEFLGIVGAGEQVRQL